MKDKRGIIGLVLIALVFAVFIILGLLYMQIRFYGIEMKTGNFIIDVKYTPNSEKDVQNKSEGDAVVVQEEEVNSSDNNLLLQINNYTAGQQQLSENYTTEQYLSEE